MSHPCMFIVVLAVCMEKLVCHMIKQSTRIARESPGIPVFGKQASLQLVTSSMTDCQYFHENFHILLLVQATDATNIHGTSKKIS